ncbi:MAG: response regulator [Spirochaetales bacterium]|nr:response regulator [Spirochaetales bacterium]
MNNIFRPSFFIWNSESTGSGYDMEVCTRKTSFGHLTCLSGGSLGPVTDNLIHNAVQILAILLEKTEQECNLQNLVETRTAELREANLDLENINRSLQTQIEVHRQTLEVLRKSEENFKSLINKIQTAIVVHDSQGIITDSNPMARKLLGYQGSDLRGLSLMDAELNFNREDGSVLPDSEIPVNKVLATKKSVNDFVTGILHKGASEPVWVLVSAEPEFDKTGNITQVIVSFMDISNRRKINEMLRQSQKMDAIGQLAGGVAHDFNNMLGGIVASAQLLQSPKRNLDAKGREFVDLILEASVQASELTNKLLTFSRKTEVSFKTVQIHSIIDNVISLLDRTIDKRIEISASREAEESGVMGDATALQNSLLNMGINASHAMPEGGRLQIGTRNLYLDESYCHSLPFDITEGNFIEIEVRDTGKGISRKNIGKIFEPFYTTKEQGRGTGLGLYTVYATVQNHHGAITVYSEVGEGTVFHLYLPCREGSQTASASRKMTHSGTGVILLVDDEKLIRISGKETLKEMGYSVLLAENGVEALRVFEEKHSEIDLVIMDMLMPEMNGSDAFFRMKKIDKDCRIIITSGFTKDENLREMKKAGLAGFLQKPFRNYELSRMMEEVLQVSPEGSAET